MGGGLMQLVAYGAQDVYLSGNPQITFFKVVYRRHTNFSVEPIQQTWNGSADFGRTVTCNVNRNGDLITNMYVAVRLNAVATNTNEWGYVNRLGHALIENVKIEIGGSKIDEQYGDWLNVWHELTHPTGQKRGYDKMIGDDSALTTVTTAAKNGYQMYVPLQFWFNRNNGLALPLIALQYHDVRITLKFRDQDKCINYLATKPTLTNLMADSYLLIDYVYLDSEERKRFAQASHEYLIEQLQFTGSETLNAASNKYRLNFNHPSKYLIWVSRLSRYVTATEWVAYAFDGDWSAAKDRFAKIITAASRTGVVHTTGSVTVPNPNGGITYSAGEVVDAAGGAVANSTVITADLLAKCEVKFLVESVAGATAVIGSTPAKLLENAVVYRNDLTMEDISSTLAQLTGTNTAEASEVLALFKQTVIDYTNYGNMLDGSENPVTSGKLQLNGHDRFQARDGNYFNYVQPAQHFVNTPSDGVNVYSFALKAADHQPTGTCNFSRIDNATLQVDVGSPGTPVAGDYISKYVGSNSSSVMNIYTQNYNVLRVMSGMAGTAYSN